MSEFQDMRDLTGWVEVDCDQSNAIRDPGEPDGGYGSVTVGSSFTNMEDSELGRAEVYTEWWRDDKPVLRDYLDPKHSEPCKHYAPEEMGKHKHDLTLAQAFMAEWDNDDDTEEEEHDDHD